MISIDRPYFFYKEVEMTDRSKFNVDKDKSKRSYNGIIFDSVLEMKYYRDVLCPLVESGEVISYELQKPYELQPKFVHDGKTVLPIKYVADFVVTYKNGVTEVIVDLQNMKDKNGTRIDPSHLYIVGFWSTGNKPIIINRINLE